MPTVESGIPYTSTEPDDLTAGTAAFNEQSEDSQLFDDGDRATVVQVSHMPKNLRQLGADGTGSNRPLSSEFSSLAAAQAVYPAATSLSDQLDWAAAQSALSSANLYVPPGEYRLNKTLDARGSGRSLYGEGQQSILRMHSNNLPIVQVGGGPGRSAGGLRLEQLKLAYNTVQQAATHPNSSAVEIENLGNGSIIRQINIENPARGFYNINNGYCYSVHFDSCRVWNYAISAFDVGNNGGITGNIVSNLYTHNNQPDNSRRTPTSEPIVIRGWDDGVFNQLNVEHTRVRSAIQINNCGSIKFNSLHMEGVELKENFAGLILILGANAVVLVDTWSFVWSFITTANNVSLWGVIKADSNSRTTVRGFQERHNTIEAAQSVFFYSGTAVGGATYFEQTKQSGVIQGQNIPTQQFPILKRDGENWFHRIESNRNILWGSAAPTSYTWSVGDKVMNTSTSEQGSASSKYVTLGWVCVTAGTPGTWVPMRVLTGN